ncbi:MAG TPA: MaoC/PaaZ C-terminal domain-containing protein [Candidatus Binataceae bacterium]|nr:MaoC/PaaZ C-terminal domain-containing protein [Candidatus Binataceae bacterium]
MPLNKACIGKEYPPTTVEVTAEATQKYARACNDDNRAFFDAARPGGVVAPPMFAVVATWNPTMSAVMDPEAGADLLRLVHGEQDMHFLAPIRPGDRITARAKITAIETKATGETMTVELDAVNQDGVAVNHSIFSAFIRGGGRRGAAPEPRSEEAPAHGEPVVTVSQTIDADQTVRYAEASGDRNPIHVDKNVARMAGLPGIIVHGLCTMAFTSKVMIDSLCGGDPMRLKRLRVRFSRPVRPGQTITTRVWADGERDGRRIYAFETVTAEGQAVIRDGVAEIGA